MLWYIPSLRLHPMTIHGPPRDYRALFQSDTCLTYPLPLGSTLPGHPNIVPSRLCPIFTLFICPGPTSRSSPLLFLVYYIINVYVESYSTASLITTSSVCLPSLLIPSQNYTPTESLHDVRVHEELLHLRPVFRPGYTLLQNIDRRQPGERVPQGPPREVHRPARHMSFVQQQPMSQHLLSAVHTPRKRSVAGWLAGRLASPINVVKMEENLGNTTTAQREGREVFVLVHTGHMVRTRQRVVFTGRTRMNHEVTIYGVVPGGKRQTFLRRKTVMG